MNSKTNTAYIVLLGFTAALGGLLFGFDIAIITGAGPFLAKRFELTDLSMGVAFSTLLFGCAVGAFGAGRIADRHGRRGPLVWVAGLFAITSLAMGLAPTFGLFLATRLLGGLAVGAVSILAPMYVAEVSPPSMRGRMCAGYQLSIVVGILGSFLLNYLLKDAPPWHWFNANVMDLGGWNWRWMFISGAIPSMLFLVLMLRAPETPRYLFIAGRETEGTALLTRILGGEEAAREIGEIRASLAVPRLPWRDMIRQPGLGRALRAGFFLAILIHFSGINTIIDYAPVIFKSAGFSMDAALFSTFGIGVVNLAFTLVSFWTIDRFGRKPLYLIGSLGMALVLVALAVAVMLDRFTGLTAMVLILAYIACFASCIGPVFWTLVPEIFPNRVRGEAMIVPVLVQWVANAVVVLVFPMAFHQLGKAPTFLFLGAMALIQAIYTWRSVPETKGKTLEEIEELWEHRVES